MDVVWKILATLGLVALNGYFVAAEFAAVGARASRLKPLLRRSLVARMSLDIKRRLDLYLSTCQLGITLASLGLGAVTEPAVAALVGPALRWMGMPELEIHGLAFAIALAISTSLHVVVGEVAPKNWAIFYPDKLLPVVAVPLVIFTYVFYPVIWLLNAASNGLLRVSGIKVGKEAHGGIAHSEEELRALLAQAVSSGTISGARGRMLRNVLEFSELKVRQVMTPRTQVEYLLVDQPIGQVLKTVQRSGFTRYPLCDGDIDHVVGLVHMKDLFNHLKLVPGKLRFADANTPEGHAIAVIDGLPGSQVHVIGSGEIDLRQIRRDVLFVPEQLPLPRLLRQFQASQLHLAVVVDEYGATKGIATLEDVLEQIVGQIEDEFDMAPTDFVAEGESFRVSGLFPLHGLRSRLAVAPEELEAQGVDSIGGYVVQKLGRFPRPGDVVGLGSYRVRVVNVQRNRVGQVLITPVTQEAAKADGPGVA